MRWSIRVYDFCTTVMWLMCTFLAPGILCLLCACMQPSLGVHFRQPSQYCLPKLPSMAQTVLVPMHTSLSGG